jgi:hypothetical protein
MFIDGSNALYSRYSELTLALAYIIIIIKKTAMKNFGLKMVPIFTLRSGNPIAPSWRKALT